MVLSTVNKIPWESIGPLVLFWMIPVEIAKLEHFVNLLTKMSYQRMLKMIWYMMIPKNSWLIDMVDPNVQDAYDCIASSPQLAIEHTRILRIGKRRLFRDEIMFIQTKMMIFFHDNNFDSHTSANMIFSVLRTSEPELIEELFHYYNQMYQQYQQYESHDFTDTHLHLSLPPLPHFTERSRLRERMCVNRFSNDHRMMSMHFKLESEIADFRENIAEKIIINMKTQLINLHQMLEEHPLDR